MKALLVIDMQHEMQLRLDRNQPHINGDAPAKIAALTKHFRDADHSVIHVRHSDADPASPFHPDAATWQPMTCAEARAEEVVVYKTTSSPFASTTLERQLRDRRIDHLYVVGAVAGFCITSTVRAASDLGFAVSVVRDAVLGFDLPSASLSADEIFRVSLGLLAADFATLMTSEAVMASL